MSAAEQTTQPPQLAVEALDRLRGPDMHDLCEAADLAIKAEGGFGWLDPPPREVMERYWQGVLAVPGRTLFVARLDGVIVGSLQLVRPPASNEAQAKSVTITTTFMAPWARGHGLARMLLETAEARARAEGFQVLNMDMRETQERAIALAEQLGFEHWGTHPAYATVNGATVAGRYYMKRIA